MIDTWRVVELSWRAWLKCENIKTLKTIKDMKTSNWSNQTTWNFWKHIWSSMFCYRSKDYNTQIWNWIKGAMYIENVLSVNTQFFDKDLTINWTKWPKHLMQRNVKQIINVRIFFKNWRFWLDIYCKDCAIILKCVYFEIVFSIRWFKTTFVKRAEWFLNASF